MAFPRASIEINKIKRFTTIVGINLVFYAAVLGIPLYREVRGQQLAPPSVALTRFTRPRGLRSDRN